MSNETLGLVLNFAGALALAIGSGIQSEISMTHLKATMNYPGSPGGLVKNAVKKNIRHIKNMQIAKWIIYIGYLLFIAGFALQLFGSGTNHHCTSQY
ncbi:MAG TPA: hypothetical protein VK787_09245 [Puia sp.]|jgi:hypothetical protein|nr:hypothetical protein [Puia sp.]